MSNPNIQLISTLNPYKDRNTINARVTSKTEVKKWANERGEGRLFSVNLLDASGEIRLTCFNDTVDQYFDLLQVGKVYEFANFQVKIAKRKFGVECDYELSVDSNTTIKAVLEDVSEILPFIIPLFPFLILLISKRTIFRCNWYCKGMWRTYGNNRQIHSKQLIKRDLTLVDTSSASIRLTLWVNKLKISMNRKHQEIPVIAIKGVRVNEYQGRTLSLQELHKFL